MESEIINIIDRYISDADIDIKMTKEEIRRNNTRLDVFEHHRGKLETMRTKILEELKDDDNA